MENRQRVPAGIEQYIRLDAKAGLSAVVAKVIAESTELVWQSSFLKVTGRVLEDAW